MSKGLFQVSILQVL